MYGYRAYYDHSMTGRGVTRAVTLGCVVNPLKVWERFDPLWNAAMKRGDAEGKVLHMKEIVHGEGEWVGWKAVEKQTALFKRLVPVIRQRIARGVCLSYPQALWDNITHVNVRPGRPHSPLAELFQAMLEALYEHVHPTEEDPVISYMEEDQAVEHDVIRQFHYVARLRGWEKLFPTIMPIPKGPPALQVADMVAYEGSRFFSEQDLTTGLAYLGRHVRRPPRPPRRLCLELRACPQFEFKGITLANFQRFANASVEAGKKLRNTPGRQEEVERHFEAASKKAQRERSALGAARKRARLKKERP